MTWRSFLRLLGALAPFAAAAGSWVIFFEYLPNGLYRNEELVHYVIPTLGSAVVGALVVTARLNLRGDGGGNSNHIMAAETLLFVDQMVEATVSALIAELGQSAKTGWYGWPHFLGVPQEYGQGISPLGTAYGLRTLGLSREPRFDIIARVGSSLLDMQLEGGGWASSSQSTIARPEVTAFILASLHNVGVPSERITPLVSQLEESCNEDHDAIGMSRTFVVASSLAGLTTASPDSETIPRLVENLCEGAIPEQGGRYHWAASTRPAEAQRMRPSTVHTARAAWALTRCNELGRLPRDFQDLLGGSVEWLRGHADLASTSEEVIRFVHGNRESLVVKHFTSSWVARLLMAMKVAPDDDLLAKATNRVLAYRQHRSLWRWDTGEYPIWMTYQGLSVLIRAAVVPERPI